MLFLLFTSALDRLSFRRPIVLPFCFSLAAFLAPMVYAEQTIPANSTKAKLQQRSTVLELQSTIVGNQEQPEVIYIVPWQQIEAPAPSYKPMQQMVDGQFDLLDRDEWRRKIDLQKALEGKSGE